MGYQTVGLVWQKASSALIERWLGIRTTGYVGALNAEGIHYTPLPYIMVSRMLRVLALRPVDVLVDIGSGKGRVVCCAARHRLRKVIGIELNPDLVQIAQENVRRLRGRRAEVEIVNVSAEEYGYDEANVIYLYNPFTERLTTRVLELIHASFQRSPRSMRLVYANPVHECAFQRFGWLEKFSQWEADEFPGFGYPVSFWRTRDVRDGEKSRMTNAAPS